MPEQSGREKVQGELTPLVVGADQRTSSLAVRDRLYVEEVARIGFLHALGQTGLHQALLVSTCDRVEVLAVHADPDEATYEIMTVLARHARLSPEEIAPQLYVLSAQDALRHVFSVAASLESTVVGEPHILGQIKDSHREARAAGLVGSELEAIVQRALAIAKRVRTETSIGAGPVSVAAAAIDLARRVHGDLSRVTGLMIGTGEVGELLAEALRGAGLAHLAVTDTRPSRAEAAARALGCHILPIEGLADGLAASDITLGCLGSRTPVVSQEAARAALRRRRNRPIVLIDTAIPGDIDPLADRLDGVFLYTLDDLERTARKGRTAREGELASARAMIEEAIAAFVKVRAERAAVPALARLQRHFELTRLQALRDAGGDADKATRLLVNRLLHDPFRRLRRTAGQGEAARRELEQMEELLGRLFGAAEEDDDRER